MSGQRFLPGAPDGEARYYYWTSKLKRSSIPVAGTGNWGFIPLKINGGLEEGLPLAKIVLNKRQQHHSL